MAAVPHAAENGHSTGLVTVAPGRFRSTARVRLFGPAVPGPATVSARAHLRDGMPSPYRADDFAMRLIGALEEVLDPIVAILDALPSYIDADLAPHDVVELVSAWLGVELDETHRREHRREVIRCAPELGRRRGTRAGLELALRLAFPEVPLRVRDGGGVVWATDPGELPRAAPPALVVYCEERLPDERLAAIARFIDRMKPVHVAAKLRVRLTSGAEEGEQP
jgi:phage tail-like protein